MDTIEYKELDAWVIRDDDSGLYLKWEYVISPKNTTSLALGLVWTYTNELADAYLFSSEQEAIAYTTPALEYRKYYQLERGVRLSYHKVRWRMFKSSHTLGGKPEVTLNDEATSVER